VCIESLFQEEASFPSGVHLPGIIEVLRLFFDGCSVCGTHGVVDWAEKLAAFFFFAIRCKIKIDAAFVSSHSSLHFSLLLLFRVT